MAKTLFSQNEPCGNFQTEQCFRVLCSRLNSLQVSKYHKLFQGFNTVSVFQVGWLLPYIGNRSAKYIKILGPFVYQKIRVSTCICPPEIKVNDLIIFDSLKHRRAEAAAADGPCLGSPFETAGAHYRTN